MKIWILTLAGMCATAAAFAAEIPNFDEVLEQGGSEACVVLGKQYYEGQTVGQDFTKAARLFYSAAAKGDSEAQYWMSKMYSEGSGLRSRPDKALVWALAGAKKHHPDCQNLLGVYYSHGIGVATNQAVAAEWFRKAAEQGNAKAQFNLGSCYEFGTGVDMDLEQAVSWYRKSAEGGCAVAQSSLGSCYEYGLGVPVDNALAVMWYDKAANQDDVAGQLALGLCLELGRGVEKNPVAAAAWYRRAAESGNAVGMMRLGACYEAGRGVPQDVKAAAELYGSAAEAGNPRGQFLYGTCFERGRGVEINEGMAREWYEKAAEKGVNEARQRLLYLNYDEKAATARAEELKKTGLVMKGLYLDMPIQDAAIVLEKRLREAGRDVMLTVSGDEQQRKILLGKEIEILADKSGNVKSFYFAVKIVHELFSPGSTSNEEGMKDFMKAYAPANASLSPKDQAIVHAGRQIGIQKKHVYKSSQGYELAFYDSYIVQKTVFDAEASRLGLCRPIGSMMLGKITAD